MTKANENRLQIAIDYMEGLPDERPLRLHQGQVVRSQVAPGLSLSEKLMAIRAE